MDLSRQIWHQVDADVNTEEQMLNLDTPQPSYADIYYTNAVPLANTIK